MTRSRNAAAREAGGMSILLRLPAVSEESLAAALAALQTINELWLMQHPDTPRLYESGIRYEPENGTEEWLPWPFILHRGVGDCEDLAAARASELRVFGEDPGATAIAYRSGPHLWHSVVLRGDGTIEDPSLALGMGWHEGVMTPGSLFR